LLIAFKVDTKRGGAISPRDVLPFLGRENKLDG